MENRVVFRISTNVLVKDAIVRLYYFNINCEENNVSEINYFTTHTNYGK